MRSLWSGMISFGLINIPVRLYTAARERSLNFDYLRRKDLCPIRYARVCRTTGEEVPYRDIVKGYEYQKGDYVVLQDEDFKRANVRRTQTMEVVDFAREDEIDIKFLEKPFYVEPRKDSARIYALFREALERSGKVAIVKFVMRTREHLGLLKAEGRAIVLDQMRFQTDLLDPAELDLPGKEELSEREIELALKLVDQMTSPFHPEEFKDTYTEELKELIENKARGKTVRPRGGKATPTKIPELLAKLRESLEYAEAGRR